MRLTNPHRVISMIFYFVATQRMYEDTQSASFD